jgi:5-methylcytosine-specific restriction enzyme A
VREPWARNSTRRASLPKSWWRLRWQVLERDGHQCQIQIEGRCIGRATEVDHVEDRDDHSRLRAACQPCHAHRSAQQGGQAAGKARAARLGARKRPPERHPGLR